MEGRNKKQTCRSLVSVCLFVGGLSDYWLTVVD